MGHVIEHIALEIQTLAGMDVGFGRTRTYGEEGGKRKIRKKVDTRRETKRGRGRRKGRRAGRGETIGGIEETRE